MPDSVYKLVASRRSHFWITKGRGMRTIGTVVVLAPTFGRAKDPPMSLKAGKDVRLATYCPFPFFSNFLVQNLLRGIVVRLLINYQHNIGT